MADSTWCKLVIKSQTALGGFQCVVFTALLTGILATLGGYHAKDRLHFSCNPAPSDFDRDTCYNNYIDTISKTYGLIPLNVVALTWSVLCASWIGFAIFGAIFLRKIQSPRGNVKTRKTFRFIYFIHVIFRIFFLGGMLGLSCSYHTIDLPYKCEVHQILQNNSQTTQTSLSLTKMTLQCKDLHYKQKSNLNIVIIAVYALYMVFGISEVLYLWCTKGHVEEKLLGDLENIELDPLLVKPEKPTITNAVGEVDKDFIVTWSESEANSSNCSIKYRLEWMKQPMTPSTEPFQRRNIEKSPCEITGLEYDAEYEVKLFAVNEQGDSEPDVRNFKTKSAISHYTTKLKTSILNQTKVQPKLLSLHSIPKAKTDEVFTNLLIQHGRKFLERKGKRHLRSEELEAYYSRSEDLEYFGKVSGTPIKHCDEIFLGTSDDPENPCSILVVGKPGIGKSLFCLKMIRDWANNELFQARENTKIPYFKFAYLLTFRQLNLLEEERVNLLEKRRVTLREILNCSSILEDNSNIDDVTFEYIVNHPDEVLIILDGYDEYSQQDYITANSGEKSGEKYQNNAKCKMPVAALCSKLIRGQILKGSVVVVTSRPEESDKLGAIDFERKVEIAGFSSEQVKEYIEKYFRKDEKMKNAVLEHVMKNENLVSFAHIPMLCYLLCFMMEYTLTESENPHDLPGSTTDIYTKLIDMFELKHCAESEYRQKEIPEQFKHPPVIKNTLEKLSKLAAKLLLENKPTFDEKEMEDGLELEEVNKLKGSGLLYCGQPFRTALITTTKHFSFTHLTVQEFLAARWFVKENRIPDKKCSAMFFQFMAGISSSEANEKLIEKILTRGKFSGTHEETFRAKCLSEYQNKEFAKRFIRKHPDAFCRSNGRMCFLNLPDIDSIAVSFVLDIISELNKENAVQHRCPDKSVAVKKLELYSSKLTLSGMQRVCNSMSNEHCPVSELKLFSSNCSDECVDVLAGLVVSKLTTLSLYNTMITTTGVASLCEALHHRSCKLTTLHLGQNGMTDTGVASLCEALQHPSCKLTTLELAYNDITDTGVATLCEALQHPSCKLTTLHLRNIAITNTGVASLCEALQHPSCKLTTLELAYNDITNTGVVSLCEALHHRSCKLTTLHLGQNGMTDTGVASLCEALQHPSCKLTTLELAYNNITDTGVATLCEALQHPSCKLTTLHLKNNATTNTSVVSLCEALHHRSCKLTTLHLGDNGMTDTGVASLCEALQHPSCKLTTLYLGDRTINLKGRELNQEINKITDTGVASLSEALQHPSCKLTTLYLCFERITDTGVASLCEALQHPSCKLTALYVFNSSISQLGKESLQALVQKYRPGFDLEV